MAEDISLDLRMAIQRECRSRRSHVPGMLKLWSVDRPEQPTDLKEVIAIIRPERWTVMKERLLRLRLPAFTQMRVLGRGRERGLRYLARAGAARGAGISYLPKRMVSWIVEEAQVEPLIQAILEVNQTGRLGDGKIFVLPLAQAVRLRTGDCGVNALRPERPVEMVTGTPAIAISGEVAHVAGE